MKDFKRVLAMAAAIVLLVGLTACKKDTDNATIFIQGELDATYKGEYDPDYIDVVEGMTEADAQEKYEYNLEAEAEYLLYYLYVDDPTDEVMEKAKEVVAEIYSHAQYTVANAEKLKSGDMAAEVTVSPIELFHLIDEDFYNDTWTDVLDQAGVTTQDQLDNMSDEEYQELDAKYAMALLAEVERVIPELTYGKDQIIMLQLKKGDDGYYSLVETAVQKLDEVMIDYYGDYME